MDRFVIVPVVLAIGWALLILVPRLGRPGRLPLPLRDPSIDAEHEAAVAEAARLWKSDPAAARRLLDRAFEKDGQREDDERAALRARAQTSRAAAEELRQRLREDLDVWGELLKNARKKAAKDVTAQRALVNLEQWDNDTRVELGQLDERIKKLDVSDRNGAA